MSFTRRSSPPVASCVFAACAMLVVAACGEDSSPSFGQVDVSASLSLNGNGGEDTRVPPADVAPLDVGPDGVAPLDAEPNDAVDPTDAEPNDVITPDDVTEPTDVDPADVIEPNDVVEPNDIGPDAVVTQECGNGVVEGTEACDDGNEDETDGCLNDCVEASCGDGILRINVEHCDTAIAEGQDGACPTACMTTDACTPMVLLGSGCSARCAPSPIGACVSGDGCCLAQCNNNNDSDCVPRCGNGVIEAGETCEGDCPTACGDNDPCTTNTLVGDPNRCTSACETGTIDACGVNDSCCPEACNSTNDRDCSVQCGNGVVEEGETCDPPGSCNTNCSDDDACTIHTATGSAANCNFACSVSTISACTHDDGCCPSACNAINDRDCEPQCGNDVREGSEECDGTDTPAGFVCDASCIATQLPTVFRLGDLDLRDPHIYVDFGWLGCQDMTDNAAPFNLAPSVNAQLQTSIQNDTDNPPDGYLNVNLMTIFDPLDLTPNTTKPLGFLEGECTAPMSTTTCTSDGNTPTWTTYTVRQPAAANDTARACLGPRNNTTGGYTPAVTAITTATNQPCWFTAAGSFAIDVAGVTVPLENAQIAGRFSGTPPVGVDEGLVMGFVSEAVADTILLPDSIPLIGGQPFSSVLPGGKNNCARHSDIDRGTNGTTTGWWFYFNYVSRAVPYTP